MFQLSALGFAVAVLIAIFVGVGPANIGATVSRSEIRGEVKALVTSLRP